MGRYQEGRKAMRGDGEREFRDNSKETKKDERPNGEDKLLYE